MKLKVFFITILLMVSCAKHKKVNDVSENLVEESEVAKKTDVELEIYDFEGLKKFLNLKDDKVHVVNFWATWCAPCVKELPYFEKLNKEYANSNVEVVLVSLDFPHLYEKKLKPFILKRNLASKVVALDDVDMNSWIPEIDENWSGSIPATIIYNKERSQFYEQSFNYEELENKVKQFLN